MIEAMALTGNPSSVHKVGRDAQKYLEDARRSVSSSVGAEPSQLIFTSGGTEANNLALSRTSVRNYLISGIEHDSVLATAPTSTPIPVSHEGVIDTNILEELLSKKRGPTVVSAMLANNETGVIQPIGEISKISHAYNALVHCDAVQAFGKIPIDMKSLDVDLMTLSAHKIGGPKGIGALALGPNIEVEAQLLGGGQEEKRRAGTENIVGAVGFAETCSIVRKDTDEMDRVTSLRDQFENSLKAKVSKVEIFGSQSPRIGNTSCVRLPGKTSDMQVIAFDLAGVAVSAGSACSSGKVSSSHVLKAMGVHTTAANESVRFSIGWGTTKKDIEVAVKTWLNLYQQTYKKTRRNAA